jgi:hypothetical protein
MVVPVLDTKFEAKPGVEIRREFSCALPPSREQELEALIQQGPLRSYLLRAKPDTSRPANAGGQIADNAVGADSRADKSKRRKKTWPDNPDVPRLYKHIQRHATEGGSINEIAQSFEPASGTELSSLLRQIRRYKAELEQVFGRLGVDS